MTQNSTSPGTSKGNKRPEQGGNSPITLIAIVIGVFVVGAVAYKAMHKDAPPETATAPAAQVDNAEPTKSKIVEPKDPTATSASAAPAPSVPGANTAVATEPKAPVTGAAKDLITSLASLDPKKGPITKEQAEKWKQDLKALIAQGKDAIPAIREFLERNVELSYAGAGGESLGYSSLRSSLIDALQQIGGPDATSALLSTLQTSALPSELDQIARALDQAAPGQYRADILAAAHQTLDLATAGKLGKEDAAPLFTMLQQWGDASIADDLQKAGNAYKYYAMIALANLPDGAGVDALINAANNPNPPSTAAEMLGELAANNPKALDALIDLARNNRLSPSQWQQIISLVSSGGTYQLGNAATPNGQNPGANNCQYFHIEWNNQNFSKCQDPNFQPSKAVPVLNRLLGVTTDPNIRNALQNQVNQLQGQK